MHIRSLLAFRFISTGASLFTLLTLRLSLSPLQTLRPLRALNNPHQPPPNLHSHAERHDQEGEVRAEEHAELCGVERRLGLGAGEHGVEDREEGRGCRGAVRYEKGIDAAVVWEC
jgi:hypothetical protein